MTRIIQLIGGILLALLAAEVVLRLLPLPAGVLAAEPSGDWPARHMVPNTDTTMSFAWNLANVQHGHVNNAGFSSPFDYRDGASVGVVIGDSYIEGLSNPADGRFQAFLASDLGLPQDQVYNFGISGTSLPHYLGVARLVGQRYRPRWAVVLIVAEDFVEGYTPDAGLYSWAPAPDTIRLTPPRVHGGLGEHVRGSALFRYIRVNLKFSPSMLLASGFAKPVKPECHPARLSAADERLLSAWLSELPRALRLPPDKIVLAFDGDHGRLEGERPTESACPTRDWLARRRLAEQARASEFSVVEAGPLFAAAYARDHAALDRLPIDPHWTPYANKLVAGAAARALQDAAMRYKSSPDGSRLATFSQ